MVPVLTAHTTRLNMTDILHGFARVAVAQSSRADTQHGRKNGDPLGTSRLRAGRRGSDGDIEKRYESPAMSGSCRLVANADQVGGDLPRLGAANAATRAPEY